MLRFRLGLFLETDIYDSSSLRSAYVSTVSKITLRVLSKVDFCEEVFRPKKQAS